MDSIYDFPVTKADGEVTTLRPYEGQVLLIVNVASKCGLTPQYEGLEALHRNNGASGLRVLGFPCNQFGEQEPGTDTEIQGFCSTNYDVTFPVFAKIDVNGAAAHPLYEYLRTAAPGDFGPQHGRLYDVIRQMRPEAIGTDEIKWNFTKFLVDRTGSVLCRYEPSVVPDEIETDLPAVLAASP